MNPFDAAQGRNANFRLGEFRDPSALNLKISKIGLIRSTVQSSPFHFLLLFLR